MAKRSNIDRLLDRHLARNFPEHQESALQRMSENETQEFLGGSNNKDDGGDYE